MAHDSVSPRRREARRYLAGSLVLTRVRAGSGSITLHYTGAENALLCVDDFAFLTLTDGPEVCLAVPRSLQGQSQ